MKENIMAIINTLNSVEVRGKENLDKMLGCIMLLEKMMTEENKGENNG